MSARTVPSAALTLDFPLEVKSLSDTGTFEGLAAVYGNLDLVGDVIEPGAFTKTLQDKGGVVPLLWQHDSRNPIGRGEVKDSREGLLITGKIVTSSTQGRDAYELLKAKAISGLSIGYDAIVTEYDREKDIRKLVELRLWECSLVSFPANESARVTAVKAVEMQNALAAVLSFKKSIEEARRARSNRY